jgi:hypothetical protein
MVSGSGGAAPGDRGEPPAWIPDAVAWEGARLEQRSAKINRQAGNARTVMKVLWPGSLRTPPL